MDFQKLQMTIFSKETAKIRRWKHVTFKKKI